MIKKGDTVRFLNAVGGGVVTRVDEKKGLVFVEDADGFEVPALNREVVVIQNISDSTNAPKRDFSGKPIEETFSKQVEVAVQEKPRPLPILETAGGDTLAASLAFFPVDIKQLGNTSYECYLVNDSNYFLYYNVINGLKDARKSIAHGQIEPNMQAMLVEIQKSDLNDWEHVQVQIIAFKQDKTYEQQSVIDANIRINVVKFYKLHSFTENDYFDDLCMLINLIDEKEKQKLFNVSADEIKEAILTKEQPERRPRVLKQSERSEVIEVDLHINNLIDTTAGMSNADMLKYQLDKFYAVLEENQNHKGQKIVFIHGKGEGVLRKEIENQLKTRYKKYYFQDASFREYGFGATMVTIK